MAKLLFKYSYKSSIDIKAKKEIVWHVLTELSKYPEWNTFTPEVDTQWQLNEKVVLTVKMNPNKKPIQQIEYLLSYAPTDQLSWGMNWGIFLKAERVQRLTRVDGDETNYFTEDVISGLLSPMVNLIYGKSIQRGFDQVAKGLKRHCENQ